MRKLPSAIAVLLFIATASIGHGADFKNDLPPVKPRTPAESIKEIAQTGGFQIDLVAAEPLVRDPVAIDIDESGRMYVIQLPPYNAYAVEGFDVKGSIRWLEDTNHDGSYDTAGDFATDLNYPTALAVWDGGLFVGDAPDLMYLKDTDGDGKADSRKVVFTGFGKDRAGEAQLNSIRWGFDNRFHLSTGLDGGNVQAAGSTVAAQSTRSRGFTFDPRNLGQFELTSGGGQHGMSMDNWGRKFVCSNSVPAQTLMFDDRYVARNPHVAAPGVEANIAPDGKFTKLYRISPPEPWRVLRTRLRREGQFRGSDEGGKPFGFFTGATGITIYRGDAWPDEYRGNLIVGDVANNLVYRARLETKGLELVAHRADPDQEFLASKDIWFRPVQFTHAPDGTLYVLDMYRHLIEGAAFLPPEFFKHLKVMDGHDRGRIYRIAPKGFQIPSRIKTNLARSSTAELVSLLDHENGWHRDAASRLIYQRQDTSEVAAMRTLVADGLRPEGRMTALHALAGLARLREDTLLGALSDRSPNVRSQAVRVSEQFVNKSSAIRARLLQMVQDESLVVRYQLAFSLGEANGAGQAAALATLAVRDGANRWMRLAILSSAGEVSGELFRRLATDEEFKAAAVFLPELARQIGSAARASDLAAVLNVLNRIPATRKSLKEAVVKALLERLKGPQRARIVAATGGAAAEVLAGLLADAKRQSIDKKLETAKRVEAVRSLSLGGFSDVQPLAKVLLDLTQPADVQSATIGVLGEFDQREAATLLIEVWPTLSPKLRQQAAETLFSRPEWLTLFLAAVEDEGIGRADIDTARVALLRQHPRSDIRKRVEAVFAGKVDTNRAEVVRAYQPALTKQGDAVKGRVIFRKVCATCHRLEDHGQAVGAELKGIGDRGLAAVLLNILDPNREVKPQFFSYVVVTSEGKILTGMISKENANSITIQRPDGKAVDVQRSDIEVLKSTPLSFMPEGLEKEIDVQLMADLLEYLNSVAR
ncbi:MAG: c-type cytochrome [Planctomycetota bacterium]|nr:c-type cytochrome [Planctomycetota bacterium]